MKTLNESRAEIDRIDASLKALLLERLAVVKDVANYKIENGLKVFAPEREKAVLDRCAEGAPDEVRAELRGSFEGVMAMSKLSQYRLFAKNKPSVCAGNAVKLAFSPVGGAEFSRVVSTLTAAGLDLTAARYENGRAELSLRGSLTDEPARSLLAAYADELSDAAFTSEADA